MRLCLACDVFALHDPLRDEVVWYKTYGYVNG